VPKEESKEERKARRRAEKLVSLSPSWHGCCRDTKETDSQAKEVASDPTEKDVPLPTTVPNDEVALKKKDVKEKESKAERKAKGAQKWNAEASELNQAMQARMEESPIWKDESLSDQAKKGESSPSPGGGRREHN
jgi:hypothetical protein